MFGPEYVNRLRSMLARNLRLPHQLLCITDDRGGIEDGIRCAPMPGEFAGTYRCRRRMWMHSRDRVALFGQRFLHIDLDTVIVDDITDIVDRDEPIVMLRIGYADVLTPAFMLSDTGALHGAYEAYLADPEGYPRSIGPAASDLAMLNHYLRGQQVAEWRDGFALYFGRGYTEAQRRSFGGISDAHPELSPGTRVVVLGGADKHVLDDGRYPWARQHWR